jgi:hypothetical protein
MKESEYIKGLYEVDLGLTFFFIDVYGGDEFYPLRENATLKDYKLHFSKLITTIKLAFVDTCLDTDKSHRDEIISLTTAQIKQINKIKTIQGLFTSLVIFFPKLCFLLIGKRLNNSCNRIKDNKSTWNINQHRQVQYTQNREQKFQLLRDLLKEEKINGLGSYKAELKNYQAQREKGEDMFEWFKRLHPQKYFEIFDRIA